MPKDTKTLGNNKARACESLGFVHKKRLCQRFDTTSFHYLYYYHSICWSSSGICVLIFRRSVILPATLYLIGITSVPLPP